jgi:hypothetical protein
MVYQRVKRTNIFTNLNEQNPRLLTVWERDKEQGREEWEWGQEREEELEKMCE